MEVSSPRNLGLISLKLNTIIFAKKARRDFGSGKIIVCIGCVLHIMLNGELLLNNFQYNN